MSSRSLRETLNPLDSPGRTWSTGAFIRRDGRYLFAGVRDAGAVRVFAVGGRPEAGETLLTALMRESLEEAAIDLHPADATQSFFLLGGGASVRVVLPEGLSPRPTLVWKDTFTLRGRFFDYVCCVWEADYCGAPTPRAEIEHLLWIGEDDAAASRWEGCRRASGPRLRGNRIRPMGTAARFAPWHRARCAPPDHEVRGALHAARGILGEYGTPGNLRAHSEAVTRASLAVARYLRAEGIALDPAAVGSAALLHDVGRTERAKEEVGSGPHAEISARVLRRRGYSKRIVGAVGRHMLPAIVDGTLGDDPLGRLLFYVDKVIRETYLGPEERMDGFLRRSPHLRREIAAARKGLGQLEERLAESAGLTPTDLRRICFLADLSREPDTRQGDD